MAGQCSNEGPSISNVSAECSDSTVKLNIKTLDSRIFSFQVDKNMPVSSFKEKIAVEIGVPVGQQRLIFRGRVLKDDHILSEYHVENGHTLHLVERQPSQSQSSNTSSDEASATNSNRGNDANFGAPRSRQIAHSVVLGTFNVGDQGEGTVPDLSRVIGAVLNSIGTIGIGGQSTDSVTPAMQSVSSAPAGSETEGMPAPNQSQAGSQAQSGQTISTQPFQSLPQVVQIPLAAGAIPVPSLTAPIPDSLNTLSEFINRMEQILTQNGYQPNLPPTDTGERPQVELPSNAQGLSTPEALSIVLRRAEQLLGGQAIVALSHIAGRLEQEGTTSDPSIRSQIQSESTLIGLAIQHLGALLLELGRTMLTLRMGRTSAESAVNAGPAVYISPSGPNPLMVQPFHLQTTSLFGGSAPTSTPATFGPVGIGNAPRNVNIHIHAAIGSRPNNGEGTQGERHNGPGSGDSGATQVLPVRNVITAAVPSRPPSIAVATSTQPVLGVSTSQPPDSVSLSSVLAEVNSRIRNFVGNMQGGNTVLSGQVESASRDLSVGSESRLAPGNEQSDTAEANGIGTTSAPSGGCASEVGVQESQSQTVEVKNEDSLNCSSGENISNSGSLQENASSVGKKQDSTEAAKAVPLGLGLGGLERKRRSKLQYSVSNGADGGSTSASVNQDQQSSTVGQHLLQALASHGSATNPRNTSRPSQGTSPAGDGQIDVANVMSQVLDSPALNGLLSGVSQQTGVGSPDVFRNMLQQLTQSPQMRNTVNNIIQQVGSQDMGNMFAGMESGQGGGLDLSRMFQQMMPIVSQALGGAISSQPFSAAEPELPQATNRDGTLSRDENSNNLNAEINLQPVVERIERPSIPADVFRTVAENAVQLSGSGNALLDELCNDEALASEYMEMLQHDVNQRLKDDSGLDKC